MLLTIVGLDTELKETHLFLSDDASDSHGDGEEPGKDHGQREDKLH